MSAHNLEIAAVDRFTALCDRLDAGPAPADAARLLADYLRRTPDPDRGYALGALIGALEWPRLGRAGVAVLGERLDPELLTIAKETCGDAAEALALMWPCGADGRSAATPSAVTLGDIFTRLRAAPEETRTDVVAALLNQLAAATRARLLRLLTRRGGPTVSTAVAQAALAEAGGVAVREIETVWHALEPPYTDLFIWLDGNRSRPASAGHAPFSPLARCLPIEAPSAEDFDPADVAADDAVLGMRVLVVLEDGARRIYSRRGEDVSARTPHILERLDVEGEIEAMLTPDPRAGLAAAAAKQVRLVAFDCLRLGRADLRHAPFDERRDALEALHRDIEPAIFTTSTLTRPVDWTTLEAARDAARTRGAEGVVLKRRDAPYPGAASNAPWRLWRCPPREVDAVLMYASRGWSDEESVATFGVWRSGELIPVAKVPLSGDLGAAVSAFVDEHAVARHGPVREVPYTEGAALVARLSYLAAAPAPRRKAKLILTDVKLSAILTDIGPGAAARIEDLLGPFTP